MLPSPVRRGVGGEVKIKKRLAEIKLRGAETGLD